MSQPTAKAYVMALDLPEAEPRLEGLETAEIDFGDRQEAAVVGAQLAEFSQGVPAPLRSAVADCLLLAQLAANKANAANPDLMAWYRKYVEVLQGTGWLVESMSLEQKEVGDLNAGVHQAILPVITAMIGPAMAAASLVVGVLRGLQEMEKDNPWITLFDRASQHASGAKLQFGFVEMNPNNPAAVQVKLLAVAVDAKRTITQVLFFKFSDENASLKTADSQLGIAVSRLQGVQQAVADRVQPFLVDNISKLDL
jgi:hypothetical protein